MPAQSAPPPIPEEMLRDIFEAFSPEGVPAPAPQLRARVLERVATDEANRAALFTLRGSEGDWENVSPGFDARFLHRGPAGSTYLARIAKGAVIASHTHPCDEECLVLEGSVLIGDLLLRTGDFHLAPVGSFHGSATSPTGCLLLIRSSAAEATQGR